MGGCTVNMKMDMNVVQTDRDLMRWKLSAKAWQYRSIQTPSQCCHLSWPDTKKNGKLNDAKLKELSSYHTQFSGKMYLASTSITEILHSLKETRPHSPWNLIDLAAALPPMYVNKLARNPANDQWIPNSKDTLPLLPQNEDPRSETETGKKMRSSSIHLLRAVLQSQDTAVHGILRSAKGQ